VALTLAGNQASQSDWRYLSARRLALFITDSIEKATRWVVFERNDAMLWERLRLRVSDFLDDLFQSGAFPGRSSADAWFVVCDQTVNDDRAIIDGEVVIIIGIAVAEPASFRIYRISHSIGSSNVREVPADPMRVLSRAPMLED
jgi:phage tail sheath protein FI